MLRTSAPRGARGPRPSEREPRVSPARDRSSSPLSPLASCVLGAAIAEEARRNHAETPWVYIARRLIEVQQPISRSCARHLRLRQVCALSFIVLPLPHDERR